jgi:hypothetical protein
MPKDEQKTLAKKETMKMSNVCKRIGQSKQRLTILSFQFHASFIELEFGLIFPA